MLSLRNTLTRRAFRRVSAPRDPSLARDVCATRRQASTALRRPESLSIRGRTENVSREARPGRRHAARCPAVPGSDINVSICLLKLNTAQG
jgi:hypothetical protein